MNFGGSQISGLETGQYIIMYLCVVITLADDDHKRIESLGAKLYR